MAPHAHSTNIKKTMVIAALVATPLFGIMVLNGVIILIHASVNSLLENTSPEWMMARTFLGATWLLGGIAGAAISATSWYNRVSERE